MLCTCFSTVPSVIQRRRPMPALERPSAISASTSRSRGVSSSSGSLDIPRRDELLNQSGVDDRSTTAYASHGVEELVELGDATLEQVADAAPAREQRHRVLHLHVCREDQDRRLRELLADRLRCLEALRPMGWRHADVDDGEIGSAARERAASAQTRHPPGRRPRTRPARAGSRGPRASTRHRRRR